MRERLGERELYLHPGADSRTTLFTGTMIFSLILLLLPTLVAASTTSSRPPNISEDYDSDYDITSSPETKPEDPMVKRCDYDLCQDQQPSCQQLAAAQGCSCPGTSGPDELPESPRLRRLVSEGSGKVKVHWCAPVSTVTHYLVQVMGQKQLKAEESRRQMEISGVADGAEVCVRAVNGAGISTKAKHSCTRFQSQTSESVLAMRLGIIGGVVVLIMVIALALLVWRLRTRRKSMTRTVTREADGAL
ncbi:LRRN4 C-terminal-like protein [Hoplias malabaricus]|uniref:LRRN4 C-terminal-like protein n=1 Tax=Hoplias malabaricus TaxID=27720 RepID=UPI00346269B7